MVKPDGASIGKLKEKLLEFTQQWIQERPYEGLVIVEDRVIFQNREGQQEVSIQELLAKKEIKVGRHAAYLIKLSKRIFELFTVRGLSNLYAATYITPSHLIQLDDDDFNRILLTKAQEFKMKEIEMEIGE